MPIFICLTTNMDIIDLKDPHAEDLPRYIHINQNDFFMRRLAIFLFINLGHSIQLAIFCLLVLSSLEYNLILS